jgi:CubicO group peptidase (beta-lactamase class C family)
MISRTDVRGGAPGTGAAWGCPALDPLLDEAAAHPGSLIQVAAWQGGEPVLDAWRGAPGEVVRGDELVPVFSVGKGPLTTLALMLVESGAAGLDRPIADHWPAFGCQGKERITLRHVLAHASGCAAMPGHLSRGDVADWQTMTAAVAAAVPFAPPGRVRRYQAVTMSWLVGGLVERVLDRPFPRIGSPSPGIWWGVPESHRPLVRRVVPGGTPGVPAAVDEPDAEIRGAIAPWLFPLEEVLAGPELLSACIPASNTVSSASALAAHYAALLPDGARGERLLGDGILDEATSQRPLPGEASPRWGLGYQLLGPTGAPGAVFGHDGYGGNIALADRRNRLAVAMVTARTGLGPARECILDLVRSHRWTVRPPAR